MANDNYEIHQDSFEGPLDLLLHLIKKNDLEISEINIADITAEYLAYIDLMKDLNMEVAGEFLVMATTLIQIKARKLTPTDIDDEDKEDDDEFEQLKEKLAEYQKYKDVGKLLSYKEMESTLIYYRPVPAIDKSDFILDATIFDLMEGFRAAVESLPDEKIMTLISDHIPIETKIREILDLIENKTFISFSQVLQLQQTKMALIVCFQAMLELIKDKIIAAKQSELFGEIRIYKLEYEIDDDGEVEVEQVPEDLELISQNGGSQDGDD
jgi:segregation and condensation protein A